MKVPYEADLEELGWIRRDDRRLVCPVHVTEMESEREMMASIEKKPSKWGYWFGKPVCVQFKSVFVLSRDDGAEDVKLLEGDEEKVVKYGRPVPIISQNGPVGTPALDGYLYDDPCDPDALIIHTTQKLQIQGAPQTVKLVVRIDPQTIDFITMIPERAEAPMIVVPPPIKKP